MSKNSAITVTDFFYGRKPLFVYANDKQVKEETAVDGIVVRPSNNILPHHLYLILEDK